MSVQLYIDPACMLSKVPYQVPNNTHYVRYEDYASLKAEVEKLRFERIHDINQIGGLQEEVARLNSELHTCSCANANMNKHMNENARLKAEVDALKAERELKNAAIEVILNAAKQGGQP